MSSSQASYRLPITVLVGGAVLAAAFFRFSLLFHLNENVDEIGVLLDLFTRWMETTSTQP